MAKKNEYLEKQEVTKFFEEFENGEKKRSDITLELMNAYVGYFHEEQIEEWVTACLSFADISYMKKGEKATRKDVKSVREYFLKQYFYDKSEEGIKKAEEEQKAKKEEEQKEKERIAQMTPEEKFREKMRRYAAKKQ